MILLEDYRFDVVMCTNHLSQIYYWHLQHAVAIYLHMSIVCCIMYVRLRDGCESEQCGSIKAALNMYGP